MIKVSKFITEQLESLNKASLILLTLKMRQQVAQIAPMAGRIQALENQLAKNSGNSGKPPISDSLKKKLTPKSLRESGKRLSDGQKGHKGETLVMVATPDHVEKHTVAEYPHYQTDLGILAVFSGRAIHDEWVSYFQSENCTYALCNAQHLGELRFIFEQYHDTWAQNMSHLLKEIYAEVQATCDHATDLAPSRIAHYEAHYYDILRQGLLHTPLMRPSLPRNGNAQSGHPLKISSLVSTNTKPKPCPLWSTFGCPSTIITLSMTYA